MPEANNFDYNNFNCRIIEGSTFELSTVARQLIRFAEASTEKKIEPLLVAALITGYEAAYAREEIEVAHEFAIGLIRIGDMIEGPSRISETGVLLGKKNIEKAEKAMAKDDYYKASDKAVWASERLSEARKYGAEGLDEAILQAARLTIRAAALDRGDLRGTEDFEDAVLSDLNEAEASIIKSEIIELRQQLYDLCVQDATLDEETPYSKWLQAYNHAQVMQKYGASNCKELLNYVGMNAFESAFTQGNYQMASYIASYKLTHLTEAEQLKLVHRIPTD